MKLVVTTVILGSASGTDAPAPQALPRLADHAGLTYEYTPAAIDRVLALGAFQEDLEGAPGRLVDDPIDPDDPLPGDEIALPTAYGTQGTRRWNIHAGGGYNIKESGDRIAVAGIGFSQFIADGLSLDMEFNGVIFNQRGEDAGGVNVNLLFRWHFIQKHRYTIYLDGGAGVLYTNENVPRRGSKFNFTPQAGLGMTFDVGREMRLMVGTRWHHASNADLFEDNPGRDSVIGYVGLSMPF